MPRWLGITTLLLALTFAAPAVALTAEEARAPLLSGNFSQVATPPLSGAEGGQPASAASAYYQGLAAFALKDYPAAVSLLVKVAEQHGDKPIGLRAAVVATLALSQQGDRENACQYVGIVLPLTEALSPIWRAWVEEAQRISACK